MKLTKLLLAAVICVGLQAADNPVAKQVKGTIGAAKKAIQHIAPAELMKWNKEDKKFILVDVREQDEVAAGWIDANKVLKIPRGLLDIKAMKGAIKPDQTIVVYCKVGGRGSLSTKMLQDLGFKNVYNLKGGVMGWLKAGYPIVNITGTFKKVADSETGLE